MLHMQSRAATISQHYRQHPTIFCCCFLKFPLRNCAYHTFFAALPHVIHAQISVWAEQRTQTRALGLSHYSEFGEVNVHSYRSCKENGIKSVCEHCVNDECFMVRL